MVNFPVRKCYHAAKISLIIVLVVFMLALFEKWRGGKRNAQAEYTDPNEAIYEREILEDEARILPGLGEGGVAAHLMGEDKKLGEESEKKLAINVYLSDRIAYNRTLKDFRNPACQRVVYDAELPSASVILIFHNEPYSVVVRTIWSVVNSARRDQPWYKQANFIDRETGRTMNLGYPGQDPSSPFVYLKEIILVDDNSTLPELKGKLSHYVRTRLPPDLIRILRLPDRVGLTRARLAGARYAVGDVLVFLDSHCEGQPDWLRPVLQRVKDSPHAVVVPIIDVIDASTFYYSVADPVTFQAQDKYKRRGAGEARARCQFQTKIRLLHAAWASSVQQARFCMKPAPHLRHARATLLVFVPRLTLWLGLQAEYGKQGLILARMRGARTARGDVLIFLDAHCEVSTDWLRPLLQRIRHKRDAVLTPLIDVVDQSTFQLDAAEYFQVGGFTFMGHFNWIEVPAREKKRRGSDIAPTWSPTMAGGLFAINRAYYWELGAYDEQMAGWGGENLEMSFRIWQCGGTLETIPCSRVGHVFRSFHPYGMPAHTDTHGINTARMAEVWMDEYAELFYLHRPDLRNNPKVGDVTHRKILREKLKCKSFQWYLDNIYKEKFIPVRDVYGYGRFMNPESNMCLDTLQREGAGWPLGVYPCHEKLQATQYFSLSLEGELRDEEDCAEVQHARGSVAESTRRVLMMACGGKQRQKWRYLPSGQLQHITSLLCLDAGYEQGADVTAVQCNPNSATQKWSIDYTQDNNFKSKADGEMSEQEQRLNKLRGQRRISRSLLSYPEENTNENESNSTVKKHKHKKKHSKKHARKRSRKRRTKNKFILKIVRTLMNDTEEHLEVDIHCKHKQLYPNNTFVRDLVTILNEKNIKVINNGRVFERNKVTELKGSHSNKVLQKLDIPPENARAQTQEKQTPWRSMKHKHEKALEPLDAAEPEKKIIIEDFIEVTTTTAEPVVHQAKRRKRKRMRVSPIPVLMLASSTTTETSTLAEQLVNEMPEEDGTPMVEEKTTREKESLQKLFDEEGIKEISYEEVAAGRRDEVVNTLDSESERASDNERWPVGQYRFRSERRNFRGRGHRNKQAPQAEETQTSPPQSERERESEQQTRIEYSTEKRPTKHDVKRVKDNADTKKRFSYSEKRRDRVQTDSDAAREPAPVKLVMRSNLTFNLGDEFFKWRKPDSVAEILGELAIPGDTAAPDDSSPVRSGDGPSPPTTAEPSAEDDGSDNSDSSGE